MPTRKPAPAPDVEKLKALLAAARKTIRELKASTGTLALYRDDWLKEQRRADYLEMLLKAIVPNARRWAETALPGPDNENMLLRVLGETGILKAEEVVGRLQVKQHPMVAPPGDDEKGGRDG